MRLFFILPLAFVSNLACASFFEKTHHYLPKFSASGTNTSGTLEKQELLGASTRSPTCNAQDLKDSLPFLGLDNIKTNGQLKAHIVSEYGESLWTALTDNHPYLRHKKGALDSATVNWIVDSMLSTYHNRTREIILPFHESNPEFNGRVLNGIISNAVKGRLSHRVIFPTNRARMNFRSWLNSDVNGPGGPEWRGRDWVIAYFTELAQNSPAYANISEEILNAWGGKLYDSLFDDDRIIAGVPVRPDNHKPVIEIWGHGTAGSTTIDPGDAGQLLTAKELVTNLIGQKVLTKDTRVKLGMCHSACGPMDLAQEFNSSTLEGMFLDGKLQEHMMRKNGSFLQQMREEISAQMPDHAATVEGYLGYVFSHPLPDALHRDESRRIAFAVGVTANDGTIVKLNRKEMQVILHPGSLHPDKFLEKYPQAATGIKGRRYARWFCLGGASCDSKRSAQTPTIGDIYRLVDADSYGDFPASGESDGHWQYIGPRQWKSSGHVDDIYIYDNLYTGMIEYFRLKHAGGQSTYFPVNQGSNESWDFLGTSKQLAGIEPPLLTGIIRFAKWRPNAYSNYGFFSRMNSDGTVADIYWLTKDDLYGSRPASQSDNDDFTYVGPREWREAGNKGDIYRQRDSVIGEQLFYQLKNEDSEASALPSGKNSNANWTFIGTLDYVTPEE